MISKIINVFLVRASLCLMIAVLVSSCASESVNHRAISGETQDAPRFQESEFYNHRVDQTLYR